MSTLPFHFRMSRSSLVLSAIFATGIAFDAQALPELPGYVRDHLEMSCTPQCMLCHTTNTNPGKGNVRGENSFPNSLAQQGIFWSSQDAMNTALDGMEAAKTDTDADSMEDIAELEDDTTLTAPPGDPVHLARNPNVFGIGEICASEVLYGCGARVASGSDLPRGLESLVGGALLALGLFAAQRRKGRAQA